MFFEQYSDRGWGLLHTKGRCEKLVATYIEQRGLPCYLPVVKRIRSKGRIFYEPMFTGYIFVAWGQLDHSIIKGYSKISRYMNIPPGCDGGIIEQMEKLYKIQLLSESKDINLKNLLRLPKRKLKTIQSGPLAGFTGYWKELNGKNNMFAIIMNVLDSQFEATIDETGLICE